VLALNRRLSDPVVQSDLLLVSKAAAAAAVAWLLAVQVVELPQPFLAPWSALLTVHATVYRTVWRGAQQVAATVVGVLLSFVLAELLGINGVSLALAMFLALLMARVGVLREEGITVATTALFVLTTGYGQQEDMLGDRILATALGIAVGVVTNFVVLPPLTDRSAARHVDTIDRRLGTLLAGMAEAIGAGRSGDATAGWIDETRELDRDLDHAWEVVGYARESTRMNPRRRAATLSHGELSYEEVLYRLEDGVAEARSIARTVRESNFAEHEWDGLFRERWPDLLGGVGGRVASTGAQVRDLRDDLDELTRDLSRSDLPELRWSMYGALISSLRNIINVVDDVASSRDVRA
jgi:putative flippase GtrA